MTRLLTSAVLIVLLLAVAACSTDDDGDDASDSADDAPTEEVADDNGEDEEAEATAEPEEEETASPESDEADESEGTDAEDATPTEETGDEEDADESEESESDSESGESRTISHSLGETDVPADPERIVALEWTYAEDLLALGVQPVGLADIEGYETWIDVGVELDDDVTDVGTRQEPSLESVAELEPDLILGVQFRHEPIYDQLSDIAPTLMFNPYPEDESISQFDEMEQTLMTIAEAVDREEDGQQVLDDMQATFDEFQTEIEDADIENQFVLAQAFTSDSSPQMRVFIDNSMAVQVLESIGLENAWEGEFDVYGFNTTGIESLTTVDEASFLYVAQDDDNPFEEQWADNPVWNDLTFVQEDRVYPLGGETWLFGGALSVQVLAEQVRDTFLEAE